MSGASINVTCLACLTLAACYASDQGSPDADVSTESDAPDTDVSTESDALDADVSTESDAPVDVAADPSTDGIADDCARDPLVCDAIYIPFVTLTFTDTSTGDAYCGPVDISYLSECDLTGEASCECVDGIMHPRDDDWFPCHINPPEGERSTITVSAAGYRDFIQDVTLPFECHPTAEVDVLLEPL